MKINVPILYCCYNRPTLVKKSLKILKTIQAKIIYISCDGPKIDKKNDIKNCNKVHEIILNTKFKSKIIFNFRKKNLGCKYGVSKSINWFFENEKSGIILEDDIIPSLNFFKFCEYGLKKYEKNKKIMMISGTNYLGSGIKSNEYVYSKHFLIWGWATWRNAWKKYDVEMKDWKKKKIRSRIKKDHENIIYDFLKKRFDQLYTNYKDTWDIQWYFTCIKHGWLCVVPKANLIKNIGTQGTHSNEYYETLFLKIGKIDINNLKAPSKIISNYIFDKKIHYDFNLKKSLFKKLSILIKKYLIS